MRTTITKIYVVMMLLVAIGVTTLCPYRASASTPVHPTVPISATSMRSSVQSDVDFALQSDRSAPSARAPRPARPMIGILVPIVAAGILFFVAAWLVGTFLLFLGRFLAYLMAGYNHYAAVQGALRGLWLPDSLKAQILHALG